MRQSFLAAALLGIAGSAAWSAHADNTAVEEAIKGREDLSSFYQALVNTGVNRELSPRARYTVFAPTNEALARIRQDQYPCFYMAECRAQVAQIVRNHIVPGEVHVSDATERKGGLYSINGRFLTVGEPFRNNYAVDGNNILSTSLTGSGMLYRIDGVVANPQELASVQYPYYVYAPPVEWVTTTTERVIPNPACGPGGCPEGASRTITVTRTTVEPPVMAPLVPPVR